jgi:glycosyltransferase involved in cell wall biosynthesis
MTPIKTLSIIVPTPDGGRLDRLADSLDGKLYPGDEVIVVGDTVDGPLPAVETWVSAIPQWRYVDGGQEEHSWGHREINFGITKATGDYLVFQDDDDIFTTSAMVAIHRAVKYVSPPRPHLFRFRAKRYGDKTFWVEKGRVEVGMIGGHCLVTPNDPARTGLWSDRYEGDFDFVESTLALWAPVEPIWRNEVITLAR